MGFVCINPDTKQNLFLCSRCVLVDYRNYDQRDVCVVLSDFLSSLQKFLAETASHEAVSEELLQAIENAKAVFREHLGKVRQDLKELMETLANQFLGSCQQLVILGCVSYFFAGRQSGGHLGRGAGEI